MKALELSRVPMTVPPVQVKVRTEAGLVYEAPKVVVTVPLGYLKKHHQQLFTPTLSADKIEGMNGLIMGVLDKVRSSRAAFPLLFPGSFPLPWTPARS